MFIIISSGVLIFACHIVVEGEIVHRGFRVFVITGAHNFFQSCGVGTDLDFIFARNEFHNPEPALSAEIETLVISEEAMDGVAVIASIGSLADREMAAEDEEDIFVFTDKTIPDFFTFGGEFASVDIGVRGDNDAAVGVFFDNFICPGED